MDDEYNALIDEYNRILRSVEFNGTRLVADSGETQFAFQVGNGSDATSQVSTSIGSYLAQSSETTAGDGTFAAMTSMAIGIDPWEVALIDLDGDNNLDMIITDIGMGMTGYAQVAMGLGDGTFAAATSFDTGFSTMSFAFGDVNGDSNIDIIAATNIPDAFSVLLGNGNGTFEALTQYSAGNGPAYIAVGDVNGDSNLDVITNNFYSSDMTVMFGVGDGSFAAAVTYATGGGKTIHLVDVDGDTYLDVVTAGGTTVSVMKGNADGTFAAKVSFQAAAGGVGDFTLGYVNEDSYLDIVSVEDASGQINVLLGNSDGTFSARTAFGGGWNSFAVTVADVNGDSFIDVVTASTSNSKVGVLLGNGDGTLAAVTSYATGTTPYDVVLGDIDNDSVLDIVTADYSSATASILMGNLTTIQGAPTAILSYQDLTTSEGAQAAFDVADLAFTQLSQENGNVAAVLSRFSFVVNTLNNSIGNLAAAESRIMDADIAQEVAEMVRQQVLQQAGVALLAQANQVPSLVLELLA